eukprot:jgi/Chlat1/2386/Chrsp17S02650
MGKRGKQPVDVEDGAEGVGDEAERRESDGQEIRYNAQGKVKGKHKKPKPWDEVEGLDRWAVVKIAPEDNPTGLLEESSFATLFPQYREKYLREIWPLVTRTLKEHGLACQLNLVEGSMTVSTTKKTYDPFIIMKARDLIKLLSRSVPAPQALKILDDNMQCDIIKIGNLCRNKERFVKRRQRLIGPNGSTLKAIELLSGCYVLVQGNTVSAMGSYKGLKQCRRIVEDCMHNIHPIYHIKTLMIKRELEKDETLKSESWDRFLPKFKKRNVKRKKPLKESKKKNKSPFPPPQTPSKIDLQLESGEYFLSQEQRAMRKAAAKNKAQQDKVAENKRKREDAFVPPKELKRTEPKETATPSKVSTADISSMAESLKKKSKKPSEMRAVRGEWLAGAAARKENRDNVAIGSGPQKGAPNKRT